jgi:hypothetical protein
LLKQKFHGQTIYGLLEKLMECEAYFDDTKLATNVDLDIFRHYEVKFLGKISKKQESGDKE